MIDSNKPTMVAAQLLLAASFVSCWLASDRCVAVEPVDAGVDAAAGEVTEAPSDGRGDTIEEAGVEPITKADRDAAAQLYRDLFADQEQSVEATPDTADDKAFAASLLEAVETAKAAPALQSLLLEKAYHALLSESDGRIQAVEAMRRLIKVDPEREPLARQRIREAYEQVYLSSRGDERLAAGEELLQLLLDEAGAKAATDDPDTVNVYREALKVATAIRSPDRDAIRREIEQQNRRRLTLRRAEQMKERLKANAADPSIARDLVMLYVVDLDQPVEARKYTFLLKDEDLTRNIRDASKDPETLEPTDILRLGDWYGQLAATTGGTARWNLLKRAEAYYETLLDSDVDGELERSKARFALERTQKTLEALERTLSPISRPRGKIAKGNVALAERGTVISGVGSRPIDLVDGNSTIYTGSSGFAYSTWPCEWTVKLADEYLIREIRMLLWDGTARYYRYAIDVSRDGKNYETIVDQTGKDAQPSSWQLIKIRPRPVRFIRIRGTYNSANHGFHVVELEAYCKPPHGKPKSTRGEGVNNAASK